MEKWMIESGARVKRGGQITESVTPVLSNSILVRLKKERASHYDPILR